MTRFSGTFFSRASVNFNTEPDPMSRQELKINLKKILKKRFEKDLKKDIDKNLF